MPESIKGEVNETEYVVGFKTHSKPTCRNKGGGLSACPKAIRKGTAQASLRKQFHSLGAATEKALSYIRKQTRMLS